MDWKGEAYAGMLELIGGQEDEAGTKRARAMFAEFQHFFPDAKQQWDAFLLASGLEPVPLSECGTPPAA